MSEAPPGYLAPLVEALVHARQSQTTVAVAELPEPRSDADAYAVQRAVAQRCGWFAARPTAWKVGAASRRATPNAAPLPSAVVHASPATFARDRFNRILIEGEIAFRLRTGLAAETGVAAAAAAIGELVVTIEVVDPRSGDVESASPALRLADQGLNGALVVGTGTPWRGSLDWAAQEAIVRRNGEVVTTTRGGHPLGDLVFLLSWLAGHAARRGAPLAAGDVITAGTWTGVVPAAAGQTIDVEFPGIGCASARF